MVNLKTLDLNLLKVLDALLQKGSTVEAGRWLGLSQPAVSNALGRLRVALDDELFFRSGPRLAPTDYALSIKAPLRNMLEDLDALLAAPKVFDPFTAVARYRISGSDFFAEMLMPQLAEELTRQAPGVRVQLVDLVPDNHIETLERYDIDIALLPFTQMPDWAQYQTVIWSKFSVIARDRNPRLERAGLSPGDVVPIDLYCDLGHVLFSPEGKLEGLGDDALARLGRKRRVVMTMPVFSGVCRAVSESDLIALVPRQFATRVASRSGLTVYRPPMPIKLAQIVMVWHRRSANSPGHRWLRERIAAILEPLDDARDEPGQKNAP